MSGNVQGLREDHRSKQRHLLGICADTSAGDKGRILKIPYEETRFCPVCGRKIEELREITFEEYTRSVKGEW